MSGAYLRTRIVDISFAIYAPSWLVSIRLGRVYLVYNGLNGGRPAAASPRWVRTYGRPGSAAARFDGDRPLCLPCATIKFARSSLEAQRRQNGCLGRSKMVHRRFRHRHGRHGRREFLNMFKTVAQRSPRRFVAQMWFKGGRREAQALPWLQNGGPMVAR